MIEVDARGLRCPQPIVDLGKSIAELSTGDQIKLLSDDPATEPDLRAWVRMTGNDYLKLEDGIFLITKN
jgi:tRNA 2-thiouridine synthesizing protein A